MRLRESHRNQIVCSKITEKTGKLIVDNIFSPALNQDCKYIFESNIPSHKVLVFFNNLNLLAN